MKDFLDNFGRQLITTIALLILLLDGIFHMTIDTGAVSVITLAYLGQHAVVRASQNITVGRKKTK